jgi:hypothetical protein
MNRNKMQQAREHILSDITNTFASVAILKAQSNDALNAALRREQLNQRWLLFKLSLLEA